jgi:hypothetical protein
MDGIGFLGLEWLVALVAGLLATVGAIVALTMVLEVIRGVLAAAGRLMGGRLSAGRAARPTIFGDRIGPVEHSLLARESWWRLRC